MTSPYSLTRITRFSPIADSDDRLTRVARRLDFSDIDYDSDSHEQYEDYADNETDDRLTRVARRLDFSDIDYDSDSHEQYEDYAYIHCTSLCSLFDLTIAA